MKFIKKVWFYFFPSDASETPILFFALAVSVTTCGCFILWLWIVHTPEALSTDGAAHASCLSNRQRAFSPTGG